MIHSLCIARFRKYDKSSYNSEYFSNFRSAPEDNRAKYFQNFFEPQKTLDVGCGTGNLVWGLFNLGIEAYGVDLSEIPIQKASSEIQANLKVGDIQNLDYKENEFDLVTCCDVIEHLPFPECDEAIDELYRITNRWLFCHICLWTDKNARLDPTHVNLHSKWWWNKYFKRKGFTLIKPPKDFPSRKNSFIIKKN